MANIEAQIKPTGMSQRNLVDLLYMIVVSIQGICAKLDDDDVTDTDYESLCYTAIFNGSISDSRGNNLINRVSASDDRFFTITPTGITPRSLLECLYQIHEMMETLTEKIDADAAPPSSVTYEALCYTAIYLWKIENVKGDILGNTNAYFFRPGSTGNNKELCNLLYAIVDSLETLTEKLDTDAIPSETDYEELWFTDTILMRVENSAGSVVGNDITITP
jgi:hypothetical protein